jgi:hypothetical protein
MYLEKNESTGGGRGWHYSTRLSQIEENFFWGGQEKFGWQGAGLFAIRQERTRCHYLRWGGRVRVRWPIYMVTLLVSAVLIQLIPIICGVGCINTTIISSVSAALGRPTQKMPTPDSGAAPDRCCPPLPVTTPDPGASLTRLLCWFSKKMIRYNMLCSLWMQNYLLITPLANAHSFHEFKLMWKLMHIITQL